METICSVMFQIHAALKPKTFHSRSFLVKIDGAPR